MPRLQCDPIRFEVSRRRGEGLPCDRTMHDPRRVSRRSMRLCVSAACSEGMFFRSCSMTCRAQPSDHNNRASIVCDFRATRSSVRDRAAVSPSGIAAKSATRRRDRCPYARGVRTPFCGVPPRDKAGGMPLTAGGTGAPPRCHISDSSGPSLDGTPTCRTTRPASSSTPDPP